MSLSTALNIAQQSLLNTQRQTSVLSRNIANAENADYSRRTAVISSLAPGSRVATIQRATDAALFRQNMSALSGWSAQSSILDGLNKLSSSVNGVNQASSPSVLIGKLQEALQLYSSAPSNRTLAENAVGSARDVVRTLNDGTQAIQSFRTDMDSQIVTAVKELNTLLADFKTVNDQIKKANMQGGEAHDAYDTRDAILKLVSELVPISTITRSNDDLMIVTADGATLFETEPRPVTFQATPAFAAGTTGKSVLIDGVPMNPTTGANTTAGGTIAAMVQLRDNFAVEMQTQLDEVARGLISAFAEKDPNPPYAEIPGLFVWNTPVTMPTDGVHIPGLAGRIALSGLVDPVQGGNAELLRDGINFNLNPDGHASFSANLDSLISQIDKPRSMVGNGGVVANQSVSTYTTASISWIEDGRKTATYGAETKYAMMFRTAEALSNITHVNVDEEMALMLQLEQSYAASAKMMQMIDEMLKTLLSVVR
jgi:flagellar hook-associated protein 1 FlgK